MRIKSYTRAVFSCIFCLIWLWPLVVNASSDATPLLTVVASEMSHSANSQVTLDRTALLALPQASMESQVPWHDESARFEGPLISSLMEHLDIRGDTLVVTGLDGYSTRISLVEAFETEAMLALRCNDKPIDVREFGPLILLYPQGHGLSSQQLLFRTVWQVAHITVE